MKLVLSVILGAAMAMCASATTSDSFLTTIDFNDHGLGVLPADYYDGLTFSCVGNNDEPLCEVVGGNTELKGSDEYKVELDCPSRFESLMLWFPGYEYAEAVVKVTQEDGTVTDFPVSRWWYGSKLHVVDIELDHVVSVELIAIHGIVWLCEIDYFKRTCPNGGGGGDPHFYRWHHTKRSSFHGECDLVMVQSTNFHEQSGFDLHIRTTIKNFYSYIEAAAVRIGDNILQVEAEKIYFNGQEAVAPVVWSSPDGKHSYVYDTVPSTEGKKKTSVLMVDGRTVVTYHSILNFLTLDVKGSEANFADARGLLGDYYEGTMLKRDGQKYKGSFPMFGHKWQVDPTEGDPALFVIADRAPQLPHEGCRMPTEGRSGRKLRNASALEAEAKTACAAATTNSDDMELCIDDVMATGEIAMAEAW